MLVDKYGNPFLPQNTDAPPQSNAVTSLRLERNYHPGRKLTPERLAYILEQADNGMLSEQAQLFADIEDKDLQLLAEIKKRKDRLLALKWGVRVKKGIDPTPAEKRNCELLEGFIGEIESFSGLLFSLCDAIGKGYSMCEIATDEGETGWEHTDNTWLIRHVSHRDASWFVSPQSKRNAIHLRNYTADGEPLRPLGWLRHTHRAKSGYVGEMALYRTLAYVWLFKHYAIYDFMDFLDVYGFPARLGRYPANATKEEIATLARAVKNMGRQAAGVIPEGMMIEFLAAVSGQADPFVAAITWTENLTSIAINGGTLTSKADGKTSTNALGVVHQDEAWGITVADTRQISETMTRDAVYPLAILNLPVSLREATRYEFYFAVEEEDTLSKETGEAANQYAQGIKSLVDMGVKIPVSHIYKLYGIDTPAVDEPVLVSAAAPTPTPPAAARAILKALPNPALDEWEQQIDPLLDPVKQVIMNAQNPEELLNILGSLAGKMDATELQKALTSATFKTYVDGLGNGR